jgi:hypothetical protein
MRPVASTLLAFYLVATAAAPAAAKSPQAKALFKAGKAAYAAGDYKEAASKFTAAYELDPQPAFLLNIAQSYRSANDLEMAARYYKKYLTAAPDSQLRSQVEELLREAEQKLRPAPPQPPPASIAVAPPPEPPPRPASTPVYKRWWFWTAIGVVVVGAGVGVGVYAGTREPSYVKEGGLGSVRW